MLKDLYSTPYPLPPSYDLDKEGKIDSNTLITKNFGRFIISDKALLSQILKVRKLPYPYLLILRDWFFLLFSKIYVRN